MKKHVGIVLYFLVSSALLLELFAREVSNIDFFVIFIAFSLISSWILHVSPRIRVVFLLWTLICGVLFSAFVHQRILVHGKSSYLYFFRYNIGKGYKVNTSVRNYSINRTREIEEQKKRREASKRSLLNSNTGYSTGGSSHYGGGLSGGK